MSMVSVPILHISLPKGKMPNLLITALKRYNRMNTNANNTVLGSHVTTTTATSCATRATHSSCMTTTQQIISQQTTVVSQVDIEDNVEKHNWRSDYRVQKKQS